MATKNAQNSHNNTTESIFQTSIKNENLQNQLFCTKSPKLYENKIKFIIIEDGREMSNGSTTNLQCNVVDDEILAVDD